MPEPQRINGKFAKGSSGNPGGRPKGRGLRFEIERALAERPPGSTDTRERRVAHALVSMAEAGDVRAAELILRRVWPERGAVVEMEMNLGNDDLIERIMAGRRRVLEGQGVKITVVSGFPSVPEGDTVAPERTRLPATFDTEGTPLPEEDAAPDLEPDTRVTLRLQ
jgi:hypothetical protein